MSLLRKKVLPELGNIRQTKECGYEVRTIEQISMIYMLWQELYSLEYKIVIQWGPMGFGGGCELPQHKMFKLQNKTIDICNTIDNKGNEHWGGIGNGVTDDSIAEARATAYPPTNINEKVVEAVLSTLTFK